MTTKVVRIGIYKEKYVKYEKSEYSIFCKVEYENGRLSITGVEGPMRDGNCEGSCGQILMSYDEYDSRGYKSIFDINPAPGWDHSAIKKFFDIWDKWHLNDMRSACEHQRELGWTYENHHGLWQEKFIPNPEFLIDEYADGSDGEFKAVFNEYKGHICPVCGYSIGSAWLKEDVPADVIDWLFSLPDTDKTPAWV